MRLKRVFVSIAGWYLALALLLPCAFSQIWRFSEGPGGPSPLDGKKILIRIYTKGSADGKAYEGVQFEIKNNAVAFPEAKDTVRLVLAADQPDAEVAKSLGPMVWVLPGKSPWSVRSYSMGEPVSGGEPKAAFLADALGQSMPVQGTRFTFLVDGSENPSQGFEFQLEDVLRMAPFEELPVDSEGRPTLPAYFEETNGPRFRVKGFLVSHPDYGTALLRGHPFPQEGQVRLPLVRRGTPAFERALTGQVLTPGGQPIPEAVVGCSSVRTPGAGLIQCYGSQMLADVEGRFSVYPPDTNPRGDHGDIVPPSSRYSITAVAPRRFELLPYAGEHENTGPARVVLDAGDAFHTFAFEGPQGRVGSLADLGHVTVTYRKTDNGPRCPIPQEILEAGGKVPYGAYTAEAYGNQGGRQLFAPVTVAASSEQEIVFSVPKAIEYRGRVIDGTTGTPLAGAFVIGMTGTVMERHLTELTTDQWQALHALPTRPEMTDEALKPIRQAYSFVSATRTNPDGSWSLSTPVGQEVHSVLAFDQGYLGFKVPVHIKKPDATNGIGVTDKDRVTVPDIMTYPAACVTITPVAAEKAGKNASIMPRWVIAAENNPAWAADLIPWVDWSHQNDGQFAYDGWMKNNAPTNIEVPAGAHLKVRLESPYNEETGNLLIPTDVFLQPGQTLDLGRQELPVNVPVTVQVTDENGKPAEGVPLRKKAGRGWSVPHNSDKDGFAKFFVQPGEKTVIGLNEFDRGTGASHEWSVPVDVTGNESQPPVFTLKIPSEAIQKAFVPPY